jgi:16S rRNA (cytidine1402-2'-O)-methyltransferase
MSIHSKLYLVPTPIGNLEDMTYRAVRILSSCEVIFAEDTRISGLLLKHYNISTRLLSFHAHNEHQRTVQLLTFLQNNQPIALISDAGTPSISDPGYLAVKTCLDNGFEVECLPGASAFILALVESGLPSERFVFEGFLPQKKGRNKRLEALKDETKTMIFYESPYRVLKLLQELALFFGDERRISVSRELTKKFHQTIRGTISDLIKHFEHTAPKGEFVVVCEGKQNDKIKQ